MSTIMAKKKTVTRTRSAYQTHIAVVFPDISLENVFDMTEKKLIRMASSHEDENVRKIAARLLHDYNMGKIAIAWEKGILPVYMFLK